MAQTVQLVHKLLMLCTPGQHVPPPFSWMIMVWDRDPSYHQPCSNCLCTLSWDSFTESVTP